jgi:hypothetical protein
MAEEQKPQTWWQTIPGTLTAIAGAITAVAGLIVALHQAGVFNTATKPITQAQNNAKTPQEVAKPPAEAIPKPRDTSPRNESTQRSLPAPASPEQATPGVFEVELAERKEPLSTDSPGKPQGGSQVSTQQQPQEEPSTPLQMLSGAKLLKGVWEGRYEWGSGRHTLTWIFDVRSVNDTVFSGTLTVPDYGNTVYRLHGEFVRRFDDPIERSKWRLVGGFDPEDATLKIRFTLVEVLSSAETKHTLHTWSYARINSGGQLEGVRFHQSPEPVGSFVLARR